MEETPQIDYLRPRNILSVHTCTAFGSKSHKFLHVHATDCPHGHAVLRPVLRTQSICACTNILSAGLSATFTPEVHQPSGHERERTGGREAQRPEDGLSPLPDEAVPHAPCAVQVGGHQRELRGWVCPEEVLPDVEGIMPAAGE
jgi:hypothetical protein